jgi:hypothetical protein
LFVSYAPLLTHFHNTEQTEKPLEIIDFKGFSVQVITLAPQVGLEPTTTRLTAECSAIELLRIIIEADMLLFGLETGGDLLSRAVTCQVPSALKGLTSVFGMRTGGSPSLLPPEIYWMSCNAYTLIRSVSELFAAPLSALLLCICAQLFCFPVPALHRTLTTAQ